MQAAYIAARRGAPQVLCTADVLFNAHGVVGSRDCESKVRMG